MQPPLPPSLPLRDAHPPSDANLNAKSGANSALTEGGSATEPLRTALRTQALALGFTDFGVAPATEADSFALYEAWLTAGYAGSMHYLEARREARRHPDTILPGVRSVVMLALDYGPPAPSTQPYATGRIAAYAQHRDYHPFAWDRLNQLADWLTRQVPGSQAKGVCDTAPLLERDFARRAGLGWIGKNTMLIHPRRGSFFLLAALLTTLALPPSEPFTANHCGRCTACLAACPTQAFPRPGVLDASRCLSYFTIERRGTIPLEFREAVGDHLFGCDDCQTACPWNRFAQPNPAFPVEGDLIAWDPVAVLGWSPEELRQKLRGTALSRTKRAGLIRNTCIVLGATRDHRGRPALQALLERHNPTEDETILEAARWALSRMDDPKT